MNARLVAVAAALLAASCAGVPPAQRTSDTTALVTARLNQSVQVGRVRLIPRAVEDSRCPADAMCVHQGSARVLADLIHPGGAVTPVDLALGTETGWVSGERIILLAVCPYPLASQPAAPADRRIVLGVAMGDATFDRERDYCG